MKLNKVKQIWFVMMRARRPAVTSLIGTTRLASGADKSSCGTLAIIMGIPTFIAERTFSRFGFERTVLIPHFFKLGW